MSSRATRLALIPLVTAAVLAAGLTSATPAHAAKGFSGVSKPTLSGTKAVGSKLTAKRDTSTKPKATSVSYRWLRSGKSISGATKSTYTPTPADNGKAVSVKVCYKRSKYKSKCVTSSAKKIAAGKLATAAPTISGSARVGATLTATAGKWASGTTLKYQWLRRGSAISGATSTTHKLVAADKGHPISVKVTGSKAGYTTASRTSAATTNVQAQTTAREQAVQKAKSYLDFMAFSRSGLIEQLEYDGFSTDDATYAADAIGADWRAQAVRKAEKYLDLMAFSREGLIEQLEYEGFSTADASHAAGAIGADWRAQAVRKAEEYLDLMAFSREGLIDQLEYEGFSTADATYAADAVGL